MNIGFISGYLLNIMFEKYILFVAQSALCMQQNFTCLQNELPDSGLMDYFYECLSTSNISDIDSIPNATRKKSKLLKILIMKGESPCQKLFKIIEEDMKNEKLINTMKKRSEYLKIRGKYCYITLVVLNTDMFDF